MLEESPVSGEYKFLEGTIYLEKDTEEIDIAHYHDKIMPILREIFAVPVRFFRVGFTDISPASLGHNKKPNTFYVTRHLGFKRGALENCNYSLVNMVPDYNVALRKS
jgi:hypothetical protein